MRGTIQADISGQLSESYDSNILFADPLDITGETASFDFGAIKGIRKGYYFDGGAIFHIQASAVADYRMHAVHDALVKLHFCIKGGRKSGIPVSNRHFYVPAQHHNIYYFTAGEGYIDFKAGQSMEFIDICLDADYVERLCAIHQHAFSALLEALRSQQFYQLNTTPMLITPGISQQLTQILHCNTSRQLKRAIFDNKMAGLMLLQLEQAQVKKHLPSFTTAEDLEKLEAARNLLILHHHAPPSLQQLARKVGINDNKLKKGFREVYHNTVMGYLTDYKMGLALEMLSSGEHSISDVCYQLGYKSVAHFSRLFKKKCNMNPSQVKRQ
ncbi:AraC family transcriptional regulator [Chitinophaga arvensicola]|uniref:AraC-type DNA-binding protein n=1 Tax=Chitinophaga arvensicola TaxID=29529 RepID=A0A1I0S9R5_9BACT|nr:AraC family transcriptional regulator [Chitinophaga arvensicola]SEW52790.1 AraC-type DNA-binding protein [Chitinophaga arvensicola]